MSPVWAWQILYSSEQWTSRKSSWLLHCGLSLRLAGWRSSRPLLCVLGAFWIYADRKIKLENGNGSS